MRAFNRHARDAYWVWCSESVSWCGCWKIVPLSLHHCKCTLCSNSVNFNQGHFGSPENCKFGKEACCLEGLALVTEENLTSAVFNPKVTLFLM